MAGLISTGINEHFESIFEVGVDEMSWDDLSKNDAEWPSVRAVNEYRRQAFALVKRAIITHPALEQLPVTQHSPAWALFMALEHEKIHIVRAPPLGAVAVTSRLPSRAVGLRGRGRRRKERGRE